MQKALAQPHRAERQTDAPFQLAAAALHPLRATAADVQDQEIAPAPEGIGHHAAEDRVALFAPGKQPHGEAEHRARGLEELAPVAAVAHRTGRNGAKVGDVQLRRFCPQLAQRRERAFDRLRPQHGGVDQVLGQARGDAAFAQHAHRPGRTVRLGREKLDRVAAEIEDSVPGHGCI
jgi:hypothetical protein